MRLNIKTRFYSSELSRMFLIFLFFLDWHGDIFLEVIISRDKWTCRINLISITERLITILLWHNTSLWLIEEVGSVNSPMIRRKHGLMITGVFPGPDLQTVWHHTAVITLLHTCVCVCSAAQTARPTPEVRTPRSHQTLKSTEIPAQVIFYFPHEAAIFLFLVRAELPNHPKVHKSVQRHQALHTKSRKDTAQPPPPPLPEKKEDKVMKNEFC